MRTAFITGTAGFIGYHLAENLLASGWTVTGFDGLTDYYDVTLKKARHKRLSRHAKFSETIARLEDEKALADAIDAAAPDVIIHLAAQAGVRYSLENPRSYIDANLIGTFQILEQARNASVDHLLIASTSSVYGASTDMPFLETCDTNTPLSLYAATKKATETMAHSYSHVWKTPTTMFRFFTVFGPWGRPDLALFKFVKAALAGKAIDVYNHGQMARDFTYVGDLVQSIQHLIDVPPGETPVCRNDTLSSVAPYRVVNIGNGTKVPLMRFIEATETALGQKIQKNMKPMQIGDVPATWADTDLLYALTNFRPNTPIEVGIREFVNWYRDYYGVPVNDLETAL